MPQIDRFTLFDNSLPNTVSNLGKLYIAHFEVKTDNLETVRKIRVYLPSSYQEDNPNRRFPVIYMLDGKNLFDDYTSFVGEWGMDEIVEQMIQNGEMDGAIIVGIDAPEKNINRTLEMSDPHLVFKPETKITKRGYANLLGDFIFKELKPVIDQTFYTMPDRKHTGVSGSSMGGLMSFYLAKNYSEYTSFTLSFSPAFFLYKEVTVNASLKERFPKDVDVFLYVGGNGFEGEFTASTLDMYQALLAQRHNNHEQVKLIYDSSAVHNEKAWNKYVREALLFVQHHLR